MPGDGQGAINLDQKPRGDRQPDRSASHVFPPSDEKDCSIRDDLGEMLS
jgi:hypothetical protein